MTVPETCLRGKRIRQFISAGVKGDDIRSTVRTAAAILGDVAAEVSPAPRQYVPPDTRGDFRIGLLLW